MIKKPKFIEELNENISFNEEIKSTDTIQNAFIKNDFIEDIDSTGVDMDSCIVKNTVFSNCAFKNISLLDVKFENCDLSNIDFSCGGLKRVEFINCKLLGSKFMECSLTDVKFKDCTCKYSSVAFSKLKSVIIENCNFSEGNFQDAKLDKVEFTNTELVNTYLNNTPHDKIDLTTCDIRGINVDIKDVSGVTVTSMQAIELTKLHNINIK